MLPPIRLIQLFFQGFHPGEQLFLLFGCKEVS
jgi:hypothetical protein